MTDNKYKKKIDSKALQKLIKNHAFENTLAINGLHIYLEESEIINIGIHSIQFINCLFTGDQIDFICSDVSQNDEYQCLQFTKCIIESDIYVKNCKFHTLEFNHTDIFAKHFHITNSDIKRIDIDESLINSIVLTNLNNDESIINFNLNNIHDILMIENCRFKAVLTSMNKINKLRFHNLTCFEHFRFWKNQMKGESFISQTVFGDYMGIRSSYGAGINFNGTIFKGSYQLESVSSEARNSSFIYDNCVFERSAYFDKSYIDVLTIQSSFFKDIVSFQEAYVNAVSFKNIHFDKVAFFNNFMILKKNSIDLGTIRIIKNQLFKTENKIDYQTYNVMEQNLLLMDLNLNLNDKILLILNKKSNYFGSSWIRGVGFTISLGLIGFNAMLFANNFINSDYQYIINPFSDLPRASFQEMIREWLKFTFSFDLRTDKSYDSNGYLLLIFYFFKIFIGYGVYQTIAAFRKHSNK